MRATAFSAGRTPPRVIARRVSSALNSAGVCGLVRQLALMNGGIEAPTTIAIPTIINNQRRLPILVSKTLLKKLSGAGFQIPEPKDPVALKSDPRHLIPDPR